MRTSTLLRPLLLGTIRALAVFGADNSLGTWKLNVAKSTYSPAPLPVRSLEPVRIVRHELGLPVGMLNPHQIHSDVLKKLATFVKRIRQADLIASQFPTVLTDAKGTFQKPASW